MLQDEVQEEVKEAETDVLEEETETPSDSSTEEKPATEETSDGESANEETEKAQELQGQVEALRITKEKLLEDIVNLRGDRRTLKQEEIQKVETRVDELKDMNPDDVFLIERIMKSKGYLTEAELNQRLYSQAQQEELDSFLASYPEFKAENDIGDSKWNALKVALSDYAIPKNVPLTDFRQKVKRVLEKARRDVSPVSGRDTSTTQKQQIKTASVGGGGSIKSSSSSNRFSAEQIEHFRRGGFTDEEIADMLK